MKKLTLLLTCLALLLGVAMGCGALADETSPSLEFPDIIEVMPGVASDFDWSYGDVYIGGFLVGNGDDAAFLDMNAFFDCAIGDGTLTLTPQDDIEPGHYVWAMRVEDPDFEIGKDVLVIVKNADGTVPVPVIEIDTDYYVNMFLPGYNDKGYNTQLSEGESCFVQPANHLMLEMLYGEDVKPYLEFDQVPEGLEIGYYLDDNEPSNFIISVPNLEEIPNGTDADVHGTLHWGDASAECTFHFTFRNVVLPDWIEWPTDSTPGEDVEYRLDLVQDEGRIFKVNLPDDNWENKRCLWYDLHENHGRFDEDCSFAHDKTKITGHEPGVYAATPHIHASNLFIFGPETLIYVEDEEGKVPTPLRFREGRTGEEYTCKRAIFDEDMSIGLHRYDWVRNYEIENYDALKMIFGGEPEWRLIPDEDTFGAEFECNYFDWEDDNRMRGFDVHVHNEPRKECEFGYRVECTWGGQTIGANCTLSYEYLPEERLPKSLDVPPVLNLKIDEMYTLPVNFTPADYSFGDEFHVDFDRNFDCDNDWKPVNGKVFQYIIPHKYGVFPATIRAVWSNICLEKHLALFVGDGENEPQLSFGFREGANEEKVFSVDFEESETVFRDNWCGDVEIENYDTLRAVWEGEPEWNYEVIGDDRLEINFDRWKGNGGVGIHLDNLPRIPETVEIKVSCDWGGEHLDATKTITFEQGDLPDGGTVAEQVIRLKPGVPTEIRLDFDPEGYSFNDTGAWRPCFWFEDDDMNRYMGISVDDEARTVEFTPYEGVEGIFSGAFYACSGNVAAGWRNVVFVISANEDDEIPFVPEWDSRASRTNVIGERGDSDVYIDDFLHYVRMDNFRAGEAIFGARGEWYAWVEGADWKLNADTREENEYLIWVEEIPQTQQNAKLHVGVRFGEGEEAPAFETTCDIKYVEAALPKGGDLPDALYLVAGVPEKVSGSFDPGDYVATEDCDNSMYFEPRCDVHCDWGRWDEDDWDSIHITFYEPGVYPAHIQLESANVRYGKNILVYVKEEGDEDWPEEDTLQVQGGPSFEQVAILDQWWEGDFGETGLHTEDIMADFHFEEGYYNFMRDRYQCDPEWNFEQQGGQGIDTELVIYDEGRDPSGMVLCIRSMPAEQVDVTYTVTCHWGECHFEQTFKINFVNVVLPEDLALEIEPDIYMTAGKPEKIEYTLTPLGWQYDLERRHFDFWPVGEEMERDMQLEKDGSLYAVINEPGTYVCVVCLREGSINLPKRYVTFHVKDKDVGEDEYPDPEFRFRDEAMYSPENAFAIFDEQEDKGLIYDDFVAEFEIDAYNDWYVINGGLPEWHVEQLDHFDEVELRWHNFDWEDDHTRYRGIQVFASGMPSEPTEVKYRVSCTWGEHTIPSNEETPVEGRIVYFNLDNPPERVDIPDVIDLRLHEKNTIPMRLLDGNGDDYQFPEGIEIGGNDRINVDWRDRFSREDWCEGHTLIVIPHETGIFGAWVGVTSYNLNFGKDVIFRVSDENGNFPEHVEPQLWTHDVTYNIALVPDGYREEHGVFADEWIDDVGLKNAAAMRNAYGDNVTWTVEQHQTEDYEDLRPWTEYREHGCAFFIGRQPTHEGTQVFTITGDWGEGITTSIKYTLNIIQPSSLPTGVNLSVNGEIVGDGEITMKVGDTAEITSDFEPGGWRLEGRRDREWLDIWLDGYDNEDNPCFDFEFDGFTGWVTAEQSGIYYLGTHTRSGNVLAYRELKVTVTDENDEVGQVAPVLERDFVSDIMCGTLMDDDNVGWLTNPYFWAMEPLNLKALNEMYDPSKTTITWEAEYVEGEEINVEVAPYEAGGFENAGAEFKLDRLPEGPCQTVIRITTSWNGMSASVTGRLNFIEKPANVPETNTLPDRVRVRVGDTIELHGYYAGEDLDVEQNFAWIIIDDSYVRVEQDQGDRHKLMLTGVREGTVTGEAVVGQHARGMVRKFITVVVYDDSGYTELELPDALTEIGEEAFEGIAANRVIVPVGCERIGARAFADCGNLREIHIPDSVAEIAADAFSGCTDFAIITTSPTVQAWAVDKGITWYEQ